MLSWPIIMVTTLQVFDNKLVVHLDVKRRFVLDVRTHHPAHEDGGVWPKTWANLRLQPVRGEEPGAISPVSVFQSFIIYHQLVQILSKLTLISVSLHRPLFDSDKWWIVTILQTSTPDFYDWYLASYIEECSWSERSGLAERGSHIYLESI